jgi:hypothetical protein
MILLFSTHALLVAYFRLVSCLAYSSAMKMEVICSSQLSAHSSNYMVFHPRRHNSWHSLMWDPQILSVKNDFSTYNNFSSVSCDWWCLNNIIKLKQNKQSKSWNQSYLWEFEGCHWTSSLCWLWVRYWSFKDKGSNNPVFFKKFLLGISKPFCNL